MQKKYLGYNVEEKNNVIALRFDGSEYMEIINNANTLGITPVHYCMMMMSPCGNCGNDKMILSKLTTVLNKQFKSASGIHLFCYVNSVINTGLIETHLKLNYGMSYLLSISESSKIYAPQNNSNHVFKDSNATLTLFSEDVKTATICCKIKNNQMAKRRAAGLPEEY